MEAEALPGDMLPLFCFRFNFWYCSFNKHPSAHTQQGPRQLPTYPPQRGTSSGALEIVCLLLISLIFAPNELTPLLYEHDRGFKRITGNKSRAVLAGGLARAPFILGTRGGRRPPLTSCSLGHIEPTPSVRLLLCSHPLTHHCTGTDPGRRGSATLSGVLRNPCQAGALALCRAPVERRGFNGA